MPGAANVVAMDASAVEAKAGVLPPTSLFRSATRFHVSLLKLMNPKASVADGARAAQAPRQAAVASRFRVNLRVEVVTCGRVVLQLWKIPEREPAGRFSSMEMGSYG